MLVNKSIIRISVCVVIGLFTSIRIRYSARLHRLCSLLRGSRELSENEKTKLKPSRLYEEKESFPEIFQATV